MLRSKTVMELENMIKIWRGNIEDAVNILKVNTIVNSANPTLMGSKNHVDGAIHDMVNSKNNEKNFFKKQIRKQFEKKVHTTKKNVIRCERGKAVITPGYGICDWIIHAVGPKSDRNNGKFGYSSSCIEMLTECYQNIMKIIFEYPKIKKVAIPVISSGNYGMDFEYAFRIGLTTIYNEILEKKKAKRELFDKIRLQTIYFVIPDDQEKYEKACQIFDEYRIIFQKEHRAVARTSWTSLNEFYKEVSLYDNQRGYFAVAKAVRKLLLQFRKFFGAWTILKDFFGKWDWEIRRQTVEVVAIVKMCLPIIVMLFAVCMNYNWITLGIGNILIIYNLADTITYLLALMFLADIQRPSANVIRSLVLLVINYIEVELEMAAIYLLDCLKEKAINGIPEAIEYVIDMPDNTNFVFKYGNKIINFFFLTVVFSYFSNHIRQRKFRTY